VEQAHALGVENIACFVFAESEPRRTAPGANPPALDITFPDEYIRRSGGGLPACPHPVATPCGGHFLYTSGTTGTYKRLLYAGDQVERSTALPSRIPANWDVVHHGLYFPLFTGAGFRRPIVCWHAGGCVVFDQRQTALSNIFRDGITSAVAVPAMLENLVRDVEASGQARGNFELFTGGGFLARDLAEKVQRLVTPKITLLYSASECMGIAYSRYEVPEDLVWLTPEPWRELIITAADGTACETGAEGELGIRITPHDIGAYVNDPETTARVFRNGYFYPGDLAVRRADGKIRILGRIADVVNVAGFKLAVAPMEEKIQQILSARAVCVLAGQAEDGRSDLVVAIEADAEPTEAQAAVIRDHFKPQAIRFYVTASLPRGATAMQKLDRRALRDIVFGKS
jgi:acyl-coenzyme A synthetase/AMP-(fatty) acid ligase